MYNLDLFIKNIDFIVRHNHEPEMFLDLVDGTRVEFICYEDFIDVYIGDDKYKFSDISEFVNNLKVNGQSLLERWQDVVCIEDDLDCIDFTKSPEEQFKEIIIDGQSHFGIIKP